MSIEKDVGFTISMYRKRLPQKVTQEDLANLLNEELKGASADIPPVTRNMVQKWENGSYRVPARILRSLEKVLEMPPNLLDTPMDTGGSNLPGYQPRGGQQLVVREPLAFDQVPVTLVAGGQCVRSKATTPKRQAYVRRFFGPDRIYIEVADDSLLEHDVMPGHILVFEPSVIPKLNTLVYLEEKNQQDKFCVRLVQRTENQIAISQIEDGSTPVDLQAYQPKGYCVGHIRSLEPLDAHVNENGIRFGES